jgi:hypothetical protein
MSNRLDGSVRLRIGVPLLLTAGLVAAATVTGFYVPPALYQLAGGSDLVVYGRITAVSDSTFTMSIDELLVGDWPDSLVGVARFRDWTCSHRREPSGQDER